MKIPAQIPIISNFLKELFFPSFCLGCQKEGTYLCDDCRSILEISEYNYCLCNKNPIRIISSSSGNRAGKCSRCADKKLSGLYFALPYKEKSLTRRLIRQFKYKPYIKCLAKVLAGILIENFVLTKKNTNRIWENSVLIPVPLGKNKLRERGYNQSEELAKELSKIVGVPVISNNLIKIKETLSQIELSAEERRENLRNVFEVKDIEEIIFGKPVTDSGRHPVNIRQRKIFLIDDVYTTGSTLEQCARVLRNAGAKRVWGITIARED